MKESFSYNLKNLIIEQQKMVVRLWTMFTLAMLVYFFILYFVNNDNFIFKNYTFVVTYLPFLAVVIAFFSFYFYRSSNSITRTKSAVLKKDKFKLSNIDKSIFARALDGGSLSEQEFHYGMVVPVLQTRYFLSWGLNESIVLLGFIATFFLGANFYTFLPYLLGGIGLNIYMYPNVNKILNSIDFSA